MADNQQSAPVIEGYNIEEPEVPLAASSAHDSAGAIPRPASKSPPPVVPTSTKPNSVGGQSAAENQTSSLSPVPGSQPTNEVLTAQNEPRDPQVAELKVIFPDYDDAILQSVLESVDRDQDRAIDLLLGMSDPEFKSEAPPQVQPSQMTQEELDEQLARRLMLEEQEQARQWSQRPRSQRRSSRTQGGQQQPPPPQMNSPPTGNRDTMTDIQEQFNKYAEIGKKNFGALMSKVKAKIQEFEKPEGSGAGSGAQPTWNTAGSSSYYDPNAMNQSQPPRINYQPYQGTGRQNYTTNTAADTAISQPAAFYDPNSSPQPMSLTTPYHSPNAQALNTVEGYEVDPVSSRLGASPASGATSVSQSGQSTTAAATSGNGLSASTLPRGPSPANPIDGGKLGLLPKRPISLIRDPPQSQPQAQRHSSDDDDLEYAENPFEDDRK